MPLKSLRFSGWWVVGALLIGSLFAADQKPSLIGATREQVLARFGEPKSHMVAGNREVLFFTGERVVLRDSRVIEVEEIPIDASSPAPKPTPPPAAGEASGSVPTAATPTATASTNSTGSSAAAKPSAAATTTPDATTPTATNVAPSPAEPQVQIKSVRPPSIVRSTPPAVPPPVVTTVAPASTPTPPVSTPAAEPPLTVSSSPAPTPALRPAPPATVSPGTPAPSAAVSAPIEPSTAIAPPADTPPVPASDGPTAAADSATATASVPATSPGKATTSATTSSSSVARKRAIKRATAEPDIPDVTESVFSTQTYVIALVIIAGGIGYLMWRRRQRQIELEATAVSASPFAPEGAAPATSGTRFTIELLNKLEWKRFEELVAAYYNKTGVVATRTKTGPETPVHIRISWKGETRPFACVQCIPHPTGLIDAKAVQTLCDALVSEDIRRGYVVTSGKFGVPARDVAEEKHITLLSGDIFIEKLNALPDPVRAELMKDASSGDYMTPTCPRCEIKMARAPADPSVWQCPQCGTVIPRA